MGTKITYIYPKEEQFTASKKFLTQYKNEVKFMYNV